MPSLDAYSSFFVVFSVDFGVDEKGTMTDISVSAVFTDLGCKSGVKRSWESSLSFGDDVIISTTIVLLQSGQPVSLSFLIKRAEHFRH